MPRPIPGQPSRATGPQPRPFTPPAVRPSITPPGGAPGREATQQSVTPPGFRSVTPPAVRPVGAYSARHFSPPYDAKVATQPGGNKLFSHEDGRRWEVNGAGHLTHFSRPGTDARFSENGRLVQAHIVRPDRSELTVRNRAYGQRYEVVRPDHARVVGYGVRRGFVERPIAARPGYVTRTYIAGRSSYARVYRTSTYRNVVYYNYVPAYSFQPGYYNWAQSPWADPATFGWGADDWSNFFARYFTPDATYPDASRWLTDYTLSEDLRAAYENRAQSEEAQPLAVAPPPDTPPTITPTLKRQIAEEVQQEVAAEQTAAAQPAASAAVPARAATTEQPPPALDPKFRTFVVSQDLELEINGQVCPLTPGDIIIRTSEVPVDDTKVPVMVASSKPGSCPSNANTGLVEIAELQEMYNAFRERINGGLKVLSEKQGSGGLPPGPPANPREVAAGTAVPDLYAEGELLKQQQAARQAEADIQEDAAGT
jgi:hypothetical protein